MAGFVDTTVKEIDDRLRELKEEVARLEAARNALTGGRRGPGRPRATRTRTQPTRRAATARRRPCRPRGRSRGGTRANQALELVRSSPGITIPQIAEKMLAQMRHIRGLTDLRIQQPLAYPTLQVDVDRTKASQGGYTEQDVASTLLNTLSGTFQVEARLAQHFGTS